MLSESTALEMSSAGLRQRMHYLAGNTQSKLNDISKDPSASPSGSYADEATCEEDSDDESDAVDQDNKQNIDEGLKADSLPRMNSSSELPVSGAWYEDLALLPVFVSGIGTWLTGGDLLKNFLLLIFLIYYLHQIKESKSLVFVCVLLINYYFQVPWVLYHSARPRRRSPLHPETEADKRFQKVAESELYRLEIFFLLLTVISPILGALLLRYVSGAVTGEEPLSWFSTGLFVLAAGLRPWSHLVQRLTQRVEDLHDVIHYPNLPLSPDSSQAAGTPELRTELEEMKRKLEGLEKSLMKMKNRLAASVDEVYDYVDENVDPLSKSFKRLDKKMEQKVRQVEGAVDKISKGKSKDPGVFIDTSASRSETGQFIWPLRFILPGWLLPATSHRGSPTKFSPTSRHGSLRYTSSSSERLETIPEEPHPQHSKHLLGESVHRPGFVSRSFHHLVRIVTFPFRLMFRIFLSPLVI